MSNIKTISCGARGAACPRGEQSGGCSPLSPPRRPRRAGGASLIYLSLFPRKGWKVGYRLYKHINIHGAARRDAARPEQTARGEGERGGVDGRALSALADVGEQLHVPVGRWLRGRGRARGGGQVAACPAERGGSLPAPRPPPAAAPHVGGNHRLCASRTASAVLRRAARGAAGNLSRGESRSARGAGTAASAAPQRRALKVPIGALGAASPQSPPDESEGNAGYFPQLHPPPNHDSRNSQDESSSYLYNQGIEFPCLDLSVFETLHCLHCIFKVKNLKICS
ncbi:uncharacterized protein LOC117244648 [Parus major]|uniref:uncharacterized protein LOC117244648 n=1 Tax=Parus major TaxID=9157 RepID=UPI0014448609|nr:uncharacterized protein LOC117244648 [Parus major]